jgi:NAD(P)H dehydrogenase (quinone)
MVCEERIAMNYLIIYSHFNTSSFNHALLEILTDTLGQSHTVRVRDLYALHFNPVLTEADTADLEKGTPPEDIRTEQELIRWADKLIFVYPIWWSGMPAMLKGYIDRVFAFGFTYTVDENGPRGLLAGKKVHIVNTTGADEETNKEYGVFQSMYNLTDIGIFSFCGMEVTGHNYFTAVPYITDDERRVMLSKFRSTVERMAQV